MNDKNSSNSQNTSTDNSYPWYDDRIDRLEEEDLLSDDEWLFCEWDEDLKYDTPKKIYDYLNQQVWKQESAKKAAAIIAYNCFERGIKSNAFFIGPTGCGKTYIWRCLKRIFQNQIEIVDGSNLSQDGWTGSKKWSTLLQSPIFRSRKNTILVIDEADKMLSPKYSRGENVSHNVQAEGLTLMEGTSLSVKDGSVSYQIDTSRISFVFCGAFSDKAHSMAEQENGSRIGFGAAPEETKAYEKPLTEMDLIEFGVMPEFMGRIQKLVHLEPMTADDYYRMTDSSCSPLSRIRQQYRASIRLTPKTRRKLAEAAYTSGLGIRGMENQIRSMLDEALFEDCNRRRFEL